MNFLFRSFVVLGAILVLLLFAALIAPSFIDWKQFTSEFEAQASRVVGQPVKVGGETRLELLPLPYISFEDLEVGENDDGSPMMTVDRLSLKAELFPFLSGDVRIVEMGLQNPHVNLHVEENGTIAWTERSTALIDPEHVEIETLKVENGTASIQGLAGAKEIKIEQIHSTLKASSILGPWKIKAKMNVDGIDSEAQISTGIYDSAQQSLRVKADIFRRDQPYHLGLDGPIALTENILSWSGGFRLDPLEPESREQVGIYGVPLDFHLEGKFAANTRRADISEYRLEIGERADPYLVTGQGEILFANEKSFKIKANGRQFDLSNLAKRSGEKKGTGIIPQRDRFLSVLAAVPIPAFQGEIEISLPAIVTGETFVRDVKTTLEPAGAGWKVNAFHAILPGNTVVEADGFLGIADSFGFDGKLVVASRQPSGLADWLTGDVPADIRRLKTMGVEAEVSVSDKQMSFDHMELRLDDAVLMGKLKHLEGNNGRGAIIAELAGNRINTNDLQAIYSLMGGQGINFPDYDLHIGLQISILQTSIQDLDIEARDLNTVIRVEEGKLTLQRFSANDILGAKITSQGILENVLTKPNGNMHVGIEAASGLDLLTFINQLVGGNRWIENFLNDPETTHNLSLDLELDTSANDTGILGQALLNGGVGGSTVELIAGFEGELSSFTHMKFDLSGKFANPKPSMLFRQAGVLTVPDQLAEEPEGPMKLTYDLSGKPEQGFDTNLHLSAPNGDVSAQGAIKTEAGTVTSGSMEVTMGIADIRPYMALTGMALPVAGNEALPLSSRFEWTRDSERNTLENLSGQISNNAFSGMLSWQQTGSSRTTLKGQMHLNALDFSTLGEFALGRFGGPDFAAGIIDENELNFTSPLYGGVDANLHLSSDTISMANLLKGENGSVQFLLNNGAVDLRDVKLDLFSGELTGALSFRNSQGVVVVSGNAAVLNAESALILEQLGMNSFAKGNLKASASFETSGRKINEFVTNLSGDGFFGLKDYQISGFNPFSFESLLNAVDGEGFEINAESILQIVNSIAFSGQYKLDNTDAPFTINRGKIRVKNVNLGDLEVASMNGQFEVDLNDSTLNGEMDVRYKPDIRERISGTDPQFEIRWEGPLTNPQRSLDISLLEGYFSLRAYETAQRSIETTEARVIEKQRLDGLMAYSAQREAYTLRKAEEERARVEKLKQKSLEAIMRGLEKELQPEQDLPLE